MRIEYAGFDKTSPEACLQTKSQRDTLQLIFSRSFKKCFSKERKLTGKNKFQNHIHVF